MSYKHQHLYVCLGDSDTNPTYGPLDEAVVVRADLSQGRLDEAGVEPEQVLGAILTGDHDEVEPYHGEGVIERFSELSDEGLGFRSFDANECLMLAEAMLYFEEHGTRRGDGPPQWKDALGNLVPARIRRDVIASVGEKLGLT